MHFWTIIDPSAGITPTVGLGHVMATGMHADILQARLSGSSPFARRLYGRAPTQGTAS